jgi:hypothetical protein
MSLVKIGLLVVVLTATSVTASQIAQRLIAGKAKAAVTVSTTVPTTMALLFVLLARRRKQP